MNASADFDQVEAFLKCRQIDFDRDSHLKYQTYFKSGGLASFLIWPKSADHVQDLVSKLVSLGLPFKIIGGTSNVLFLDELNYGIVIAMGRISHISVDGCTFVVGAGYSLADLVRVSLLEGCGGLEGLEGVPGTVGGALVMNAGAYGFCISDHLIELTCVDADGRLRTLKKEECGFSFRESIFRKDSGLIIVGAKFLLERASRREVAARIEGFHIARHSYQEFAYPSLGSSFSVKRDFYREAFHKDRLYFILCQILKVLFRNPVSKFILRRRPTNYPLNLLLAHYLGSISMVAGVSHKSMNILINDGNSTGHERLNYLLALRRILPRDTKIENEVILGPLRSAADAERSEAFAALVAELSR